MSVPQRVQDQLRAAEALEAGDQAARAAARQQHPLAVSVADLVEPATAVNEPPPPTVTAAPPQPADPFEQKYKTLQGMYNSDVTKLRTQLDQVQTQLRSLAEARVEPQASAQATPDPKDIAKFGDEMMEMVQRYVTGAVDALGARISKLEGSVNDNAAQTAQTAEQQFYAVLTSLVPNWKAINVDPKWIAWLETADPVYNLPRQKALTHAFERGDAQQVAVVFNAFVASLPVVAPPQSMEPLRTPDSSGGNPPAAPAAKRILSAAAVTAFYNDVAKDRYRGRGAEQAALEAEINLAVAENRVR